MSESKGNKRQRRQFSPEDKAAILRRHLVDHVPLSNLCDHLVLGDPDDVRETIVAEIPDSACALGSGHEGDYEAARRVLRSVPRSALVELDGVGFFDYLHGQRGMAPNGFELHPVVAIRPLDVESEQGIDSSATARRDSTEAGVRTDAATRTAADVQVWLNAKSFVYHCAGSRWYGKTSHGELMRESQAVARGARPAYGHRCSG